MPTLESNLTLHRFICAQFGYPDLREMLAQLDGLPPEPGGGDASRFAQALALRWQSVEIRPHTLEEYDSNITAHSRALGMHADSGKSWKPFQYAAMLFTERYLDLYFADADALLDDLNACQAREQQARRGRTARAGMAAKYAPNDLRTLAFQSATGSGKTLLLHANILQYKHYLQRAGRLHKLNKVILVTPDEGLSRQHLSELGASNIAAQLFSGDVADVFSRGGGMVDIIDLHKLDEKAGIKRVALGAFEDNNLVMVDEGHLGASGEAWRKRRKQLARNGFTFEYSATFNQVAAGTTPAAKKLRDEYGKAILFDYSYRFFHGDGYGKDYQISNLRDTADAATNNLYLLACLLVFYQQCKIYAEKGGQWREFNIAKPLWVFLGRTVTGSSKSGDSVTASDVERITVFLAWALGAPKEVTAGIAQVIGGHAGLVDAGGADLFGKSFAYIARMPAREMYDDLCKLVFRARGELHVVHLTGADELQLSAGDAAPFGVINVGDASGLYTKLEARPGRRFRCAKSAFAPRLFEHVEYDSSPVNMVIGARKFVAGWNSWRVSTMGLMHVGAGEGPQIIQMFGRGVRLKGLKMSLKRHTELDESPPDSALLRLLETLNIFGMRANYMEQFKKYLQAQGIGAEMVRIPLRTKAQFPEVRGLKMLRKQDGIGAFEYSRERVNLPAEPETADVVTLDRYRHLQALQPGDAPAAFDAREAGAFENRHLNLLNHQRIYHKVLARKQRENWHNMMISRECVDALLENNEFYKLYIPQEKLAPASYARVREWEELAADLICAYAGKHWRRARNAWEHQYIEPAPLQNADPNFISEYVVSVAAGEAELIAQIEAMAADMEKGKYQRAYHIGAAQVELLNLGFHAYAPLLHVQPEREMKITPLPLNHGEARFVDLLKEVVHDRGLDELAGKEIFLMRNMSRGKGISFFNDCAFYPDFILWLKDHAAQDVLFIDPKGLLRYDAGVDSKVDLHKNIKQTQRKLQRNAPELFLHSYVWTSTHPRDIGLGQLMDPAARRDKGVYLAVRGNRELPALLQDALTRGRQ